MQLKNSLVECEQDELQQVLQDTLTKGHMQPEELERERKTADTSVSGTVVQTFDGNEDENSPILVKSPHEPKSRKKMLKAVGKPKKSQENTKPLTDLCRRTPSMAKKYKYHKATDSSVLQRMSKAGFESSNSEPLEEAKAEETASKKKCISSNTTSLGDKKLEDPRGHGLFFYFGGNNGAHLVSTYCMSKGWQRIQDNKRDDYKLKWCETKFSASYYKFREGEQLIYQIPNNKILTTKIGLLNSLREYERVMQKIKFGNPRMLKMEDFFPETFRLDLTADRETFFSLYEDGQTWICKPTGLNQGRGIFLVKRPEQINELRSQLQDSDEDAKKPLNKCPQARIVQRYIPNPLLLEGRKFDIRSYLLIASTVPYFVFFCHGYVRLTCNRYDPASDDLTGHLTNQYMQKKNPLYNELKEETVWTMERFNSYVNQTFASDKGLPQDWVLNVFTKRMQQIMMHCFLAVKSKLDCRMGYFDLIGCDFLIDENFKVWLLEMNCNPALHTNCEVLKEVIPSVVHETLDLALEIFHKTLRNQRILPLKTQSKFVLLFNGELNELAVKFNWPRPRSPVKGQKSMPVESINEATDSVEKSPQTGQAPTKNVFSNGPKLVISKIPARTTAEMASILISHTPRGKLPRIKTQKPKFEFMTGSVNALKQDEVSSLNVDQPKDISLRFAPVAKLSFTNLHKLMVSGSKTPQIFKKIAQPSPNCNPEVRSSEISNGVSCSPPDNCSGAGSSRKSKR
ncbi:inactive polyglycylase TTLL10 [Pelodytes ibericus]